ncbi:MAG: OmpP1/FadL family transporter [Candidatus Aminicenantes bacterium]
MKKTIQFICIFLLVFFGMISFTQGAGFLIYEHGATAMAMGGAFVALANDPSAVFHNPAGIAWLKGTQISLGTTLITSRGSLSLPHWPDPSFQSIDQESQWFYPSTFYITHEISENVVAGFGFFSPYGLGTKWPEDYPLKYISISDDMKTFIFNPSLAFKLNENLSVGFGVSYIYSTLSFEMVEHEELDLGPLVGLPVSILSTIDIPVTLEASGSGWGLNAGALYKGEKFSFGFNWRGGFNIDYTGDLALASPQVQIPSPYDQMIPAELIASYIPDEGDASTTFSFPHILGLGAAFDLTERLTLSADVHYVLWSTFDEYVVDIEVPIAVPGAEFADKQVKENWDDSFVFRGGLQYWVSDNFALRGGVLYDQTPQPVETMDPVLPDADRWAFTGGFGFKSGSLVIDVAYQYEPFKDRTSPNRNILVHPLLGVNLGEGTYSTTAHLIGVSLGFIF